MLKLSWIKCKENKWCDFLKVDLSDKHFEGLSGVYVIFYAKESGGRAVRVGQGNIAERIADHRKDPEITLYVGLLVTWARVPSNQQDGVEKYLADSLDPATGDRFPDRTPIEVNLPFE
jgi:hypothetical protein